MKRQRITAYFFSIDGNAVTIERIAGHYSLTPLPSLRPSGGTVLCAGLLCRRPSEFLYPPPHCGTREARQILDLGIGEARTNEIADLHLFFSESSEPLCKKIREVGVDFVDGGIDPPPILGSHPLGAAGRLLDRLQHVASSSRKF